MFDTQTIALSVSGRIKDHPGYLHSITFNCGTAANGVVLYDDRAANADREIADIASVENGNVHLSFNPPLHLSYGLYVTVESGTGLVTLQWSPGLE